MCPPSKHPEVTLFKPSTKTSFTVVGTDEPHFSRRKEILKKHPEIKQLYGPDIRLLPSILVIVTVQLALSLYATKIQDWRHFVFLAYSVGGTLTHWLSLGTHELAHNLCFHTTLYNEVLAMIANCAQSIPSCISFKRYHLEHHYKQGENITDVDVPTDWEGRFFNNTFKKTIFVFLQPAFYALRPMFTNPKAPTWKEGLNFAVVLGFDAFLAYTFGGKALLFNFASTLLGMGLHPVAGHFISEHYTFVAGQETYSYYGPLNLVSFNVGYHNEHHDFPKISGFRLPMVKKIAPEYYEDLHSYNSWPKVLYDYITRPDMSPYSRIKRFPKDRAAQEEKSKDASDMAISSSGSEDSEDEGPQNCASEGKKTK
ncbi:Sphingolipid delta(4)-desaturase DES1 [Seminavis robusta]|uniref:Sphingolipid delta(4)-desaturase DES1 n=1 Tax=Seminavis robusta TaxID=568900 RepID=A0A9N8E586_9STRA|nr:Sphingolipid delta(4)-desaturase DES1 [Seminavis robusta]|eukprot:Sro530_g161300.1 Sphingolipid delta(4)-desaturase DES1 (369) ;mRNA; r:51024-52130